MTLGNKNLNNQHDPIFGLFRIIDVVLISLAFFLSGYIYDVEANESYVFQLTLTIIFYLVIAESIKLYQPIKIGKFFNRIVQVVSVVLLAFMLAISSMFLSKVSEDFSRVFMVLWLVQVLFYLVLWRLTYRAIRKKRFKQGIGSRKSIIIGCNQLGVMFKGEIDRHIEHGVKFCGFYDDRPFKRLSDDLCDSKHLKGTVGDALKVAQKGEIDRVYICLPLKAEERIQDVILKLSDSTVDVMVVPDLFLSSLMSGNISQVGQFDTISVFEAPLLGINGFFKRVFDVVFSIFVLVFLSPVFLAIALAVKLSSPGPVLFRQDRYGLNGQKISVHKFRSMTVMENSDKVVQAKKGDVRITKVGAFLRRTSLDELPQFWDALMGRMSVVGPRPHAVAHNEEYRKLVDYYMLRHQVKPGITGWAQINGWRGETDTLDKMEKRIEYDLDYIRHWNLWFDIKIVFLTVFKGFINKNAY